MIRTQPSRCPITSLLSGRSQITEYARRRKGNSNLMTCLRNDNVPRYAETPIINNIFTRLLPSTLPRANALSPLKDAMPLKNISGADVPSATSVMPMISGGTFRRLAREDDPNTKALAPYNRAVMPMIMNSTSMTILVMIIFPYGDGSSPVYLLQEKQPCHFMGEGERR